MPEHKRPPITGKGHARAQPLPDAPRPTRDPDGVAPAKKAVQDEPKGLPNSDRHHMETVIARQKPPRHG
jgi:hypothetical protein